MTIFPCDWEYYSDEALVFGQASVISISKTKKDLVWMEVKATMKTKWLPGQAVKLCPSWVALHGIICPYFAFFFSVLSFVTHLLYAELFDDFCVFMFYF